MAIDLWQEIELSTLEIEVPRFIDQEITALTLAAILQGGCESGAYMPAVTYHEALKTMLEHGDDVFETLEEALGEIPKVPDDCQSWEGMACFFVSSAVELWASGIEQEVSDALEELAA